MNTLATDMLKRDEGYRRFPYRDTVGKLTVGYGLNLEDEGLSEADAALLLGRKVIERERELMAQAGATFHKLSHSRQAVLLNMAYQLGVGGLLRFRRMWAALDAGDFARAADEMLASRWAEQTPARAERLARIMKTDSAPSALDK